MCRPPILRATWLSLLGVLLGALVGGCGAARESTVSEPRSAAAAPSVAADEERSPPAAPPPRVEDIEGEAEQVAVPLMAKPAVEPKAVGGHVTPTELVVPAGTSLEEGDGILIFEAFGPAPGTSPEQFDEWTKLVRERFLGDPTPEQLEGLDAQLEELPIIDATPVFINALRGLDMAEPVDIVRAGAITKWWYFAQLQYKQVVLDANPAELLPLHVRNRMLVIDAWVRMWKRTLKQEGGVARLRLRVEEVVATQAAARAQQQREYEEKLRRRAAEKAAESEGDDPR